VASDIVIEIDGKPTENSVGGWLDTITDFHFGTVYASCIATKVDGAANATVTPLTPGVKILDTKVTNQNLDVPAGFSWYAFNSPAGQTILAWHFDFPSGIWIPGSDLYHIRMGYATIAAAIAAAPSGIGPLGSWVPVGNEAAANAYVASHPIVDLTNNPLYFHTEGGPNSTPAWKTGSILRTVATHHTVSDRQILVKMAPSHQTNQFTFNASSCDNGLIRLYVHKTGTPPITNIASLNGPGVMMVNAGANPGTTSWRAFKDPNGVWHMPLSGNWS
jgi:hypothetical protein